MTLNHSPNPPEIVSWFWYPWCTSAYIPSFVRSKIKELRNSGEYFDVKHIGPYIYVKRGRTQDGTIIRWTHERPTEATNR